MKRGWFALAGGTLVILAAVLFFRTGNPASQDDESAGNTRPGAASVVSSPPSKSGAAGRRDHIGPKGTSAADAALDPVLMKELESVWRSPDEKAILDTLDKVGKLKSPAQWQAVSDVLVQRAVVESRSEIIDYLLATADAGPEDVRRGIYAAALDNKAVGVGDSARLELQNMTGQVFRTTAEARAWISSHPVPAEDPLPDDQ